MSKQPANNLFIVPPLATKYAGFYQQLLNGVLSYRQLGNRLIQRAEHAHIFRQFDRLQELALILSDFPLEDYRTIGQYYLALNICRNGLGEMEQAQVILENVASAGPLNFRARAMLSLSAISWVKKKPSETLNYRLEAAKVGEPGVSILALRGIGVLKGREGYHRSSLRDLERLYPLIEYAPPHVYFDCLNSLAVELGE